MSQPANDNFAQATVLSGTTGTLVNQTTVGATREDGELNILYLGIGAPIPAPPSNETVWYTFTIDATVTTIPLEMWFATTGSLVGMEIQVFYVTTSGAPASWNNLEEVTYTINHSMGLGYTEDCGVAVICSPGTQYYIRVASRLPSVDGSTDGTFALLWNPYFPLSIGSCATCPPRVGIGGCLETRVATAQMTASYLNQQTSFGTRPPGRYWARYCQGSYYAYQNGFYWSDSPPPGINPSDYRLFPLGYFTINPLGGASPGIVECGFTRISNITVFRYNPADPSGLTEVSLPDGLSGYAPTVPTAPPSPNPFFATASQAQQWSQCASLFMEHLGGEISVVTMFLLGGYSLTDVQAAQIADGTFSGFGQWPAQSVISGEVTWGLYQINPVLNPARTTGYSETTVGGVTTSTVTFIIANTGELEYDNVTVTLSGVSAPSPATVVTNLIIGTTNVQFSFTKPAPGTLVSLNFSDAIGESFPTCSYLMEELMVIYSASDAGSLHCSNPATLWRFDFQIQNAGVMQPSTSSQVTVTIVSGPAIGTGVTNCTGPVCTGTSKTTLLNFTYVNIVDTFIESEVPASGSITVLSVAITDPATGYAAPVYTYTKVW